MRKFTMAAIIVFICGLVPLCALGCAPQGLESQRVTDTATVDQAMQVTGVQTEEGANGTVAEDAVYIAADVTGSEASASANTASTADSKASVDNKSSEEKASKSSSSDKAASGKNAKDDASTKKADSGKDATDDKASKRKKAADKNANKAVLEGKFKFSEDADCGVCHTKESESMTDETMPASNHEALNCTSCHTDTDDLEKAHDRVEYGDKTAKRLKQTSIDAEGCETCHGSLEELAEKTAECSVLTDKNGTVVNPHALPENEDHESIDCGSCHSMHKDKAIEDTAKKACKGCHHTDVYECNTCHD